MSETWKPTNELRQVPQYITGMPNLENTLVTDNMPYGHFVGYKLQQKWIKDSHYVDYIDTKDGHNISENPKISKIENVVPVISKVETEWRDIPTVEKE